MSKFIILHQSTLDEDGAPTRETIAIDVNVDSIGLITTSSRPFRNSQITFVNQDDLAASFDETVQEIRNLIAGKCIPGKSYETR
jgi:hypothetical protein